MLNRIHPLSCAASAALMLAAPAALAAPEFSFSGYGTVVAAHSDNDQADFIGDVFQPKGAGRTRGTSFDPDSRLGLQAAVKFNDSLSAVLQVLTKYQYDGSYKPQVEWANVKYRVTPDLDLRAGRVALPLTLLAESRFVGYASPWIRPPQEVYVLQSITSNDGVDVTHRSRIGGASNSLQAYYGTSEVKLTAGKVKSKGTWGLTDVVEVGSLQLRAGYNAMKLDLQSPAMAPLFGGLQQFAAGAGAVPLPNFQAAAAQALALADTYKLNGMKLSQVSLGASYDPGNWFAMAELVDFKGAGVLTDNQSWYASAGWRIGKFTPYTTYGKTTSEVPVLTPIQATGQPALDGAAAALTAGLGTTVRSIAARQSTTSVGVRWDVARNTAAKLQFDHIKVGQGSSGRLRVPTGTTLSDRSVNLVSVGVDFVF